MAMGVECGIVRTHGQAGNSRHVFKLEVLHGVLYISKPAINFFSSYELVQAQKAAKVAKNS